MKKKIVSLSKVKRPSILKRFRNDNIPKNVNVNEVQAAWLKAQGCYY